MTCDRFLSRLDGLDNDDLPIEMTVHARSCQSCARELAAMESALELYRLGGMDDSIDLSLRVAALLPFAPAPRRTVSMRDWIAAGAVIFSSMIFVPFLAEFRTLRTAYGSDFTVSMSLVLGCLVTVYAGVFVMSHLDDFSRRLKDRDIPKSAVDSL